MKIAPRSGTAMRRFAIAAVTIAATAGCSGQTTATSSTVTVTRTVTSTVSVAAAPAAAPTPPAQPKLQTSFSDGTYVVGEDVAAGTYKSTPRKAMGMCTYTFLPRKGAPLEEASGGNTIFGPGYMEIADGQIVQTVGCTWTLE